MAKSDIEKLLELYVGNPDVYDYAYANCLEYKKFLMGFPLTHRIKSRERILLLESLTEAQNFKKVYFTLQPSAYHMERRNYLTAIKKVNRN